MVRLPKLPPEPGMPQAFVIRMKSSTFRANWLQFRASIQLGVENNLCMIGGIFHGFYVEGRGHPNKERNSWQENCSQEHVRHWTKISSIYMTGECVPKISPPTLYSQSRNGVWKVFGFFTLELQKLTLQTSLRPCEGFNHLAVFAMTACVQRIPQTNFRQIPQNPEINVRRSW